MRTGGNVNGFMDLNMMRLVEAGQKPGPAIDATAPYLNGPNTFIQMRTLKGPEDARRQVQYWTDEGATSLKTYMQITRGELAAAINEAHRRGIKVTGHLCSVTYAEAAESRHRQSRARLLRRHGFRRRQEARRVPGPGRRARRRSPRSTRTARRSRRWCKTLIDKPTSR